MFSVFPFYREQEDDQYLRKYQLNPDAMDHNSMAQDCLCQIMIKNPQKIVLQLMENGMNGELAVSGDANCVFGD